MAEQDVGSVEGLGLADAIALLRDELLRARAAGAESEIQLPVESMTVELTVTATRSVDGKAGFKVPFVELELGGGAGRQRGSEQLVTVVFGGPVDREGKPVKVAEATMSSRGSSRRVGAVGRPGGGGDRRPGESVGAAVPVRVGLHRARAHGADRGARGGGAAHVQVRDPDKRLYPASVDPRFVGDRGRSGARSGAGRDRGRDVDLPPIGLARVDRDTPTADPVERCHAIGYPWFAETPSPEAVRETVDAIGVVPVLSRLAGGLLSVQVSVSPRPLPPEQVSLGESEWSGMSGAPVVAAGLLLGVVTEHAPREGPSAITAVPLTALEPDPAHPGGGRRRGSGRLVVTAGRHGP